MINLPGKEEFFKDLKNIGIEDIEYINNIVPELDIVNNCLKKLLELNGKTLSDVEKQEAMETAETMLKSAYHGLLYAGFKSEPITSVTFLSNGTSIFKPLQKMLKLINFWKTFSEANKEHEALFYKNLKQVMNIAKGLEESNKDIQRLQSLRNVTKEYERFYLKNIRNPWLLKIFQVKRTSFNDLPTGLETASEMLDNFNNELKAFAGNLQMYDGFEQLQKLVPSVPLDIGNLTGFVTEFNKCNSLPVKPILQTEISNLIENVNSVQKLHRVLVHVSSLSTDILKKYTNENEWSFGMSYTMK